MALDLSTLYVVAGLGMLVAGFVHLALVATGRFGRWAGLWGLGHLTVGCGAVVAVLNDHMAFAWAPNIGNPITIIGYALITSAVLEFDSPRARIWPLLAVATLFALPLTVFGDPAQFTQRVAYLGIIRAVFDTVVVIVAVRMARHKSLQTGWIVASLFAVTVPLFLGRSWLALNHHIGTRLTGPHDDLAAWLAAGQIAFIIFRAFSLLILQAERGQKALTDQMERDWLTGALNRAGVDRVARGIAARKAAGPIAVMMLDVDRFKALNDTQGHAAGDAALRTLAAVAHESLGDDGYLGRWGGDEFVCILPDATVEGARVVGNQLAARFARVMQREVPDDCAPTISIGIAQGAATLPIEDLIARADVAMYAAKAGRRNTPAVHGQVDSLVAAFAKR